MKTNRERAEALALILENDVNNRYGWSQFADRIERALDEAVREAVAEEREARSAELSSPTERVWAHDLLHSRGGSWLGAARHWVTWNKSDTVTWGSNTSLGEFTMRQVEELAAEVAAAVINERGDYEKRLEEARSKRLKAEMEASFAKEDAIRARSAK